MGINAEYMGVKMLLSARLTETRTSQAARGVLMLFTLACCLPCEALPKGPQEPKMVKCLRGLMSTCHDQVLGVMLGKEREARLISCTRVNTCCQHCSYRLCWPHATGQCPDCRVGRVINGAFIQRSGGVTT